MQAQRGNRLLVQNNDPGCLSLRLNNTGSMVVYINTRGEGSTSDLSRLLVLVHKGETTSTASVSVVVDGHEGGSTAVGIGALTTKASDLVVLIHLVVLEHHEFYLLVLVLHNLGFCVLLLLLLLATTTSQAQHKVESRLHATSGTYQRSGTHHMRGRPDASQCIDTQGNTKANAKRSTLDYNSEATNNANR